MLSGKYLVGEYQARGHGLSGDRVGVGPVTQDVEIVFLEAGASRDQNPAVRIAQPLLALQRGAVAGLLVVERLVAQRRDRRTETVGRPLAVNDLRRVVELAVNTPRQLVEAAIDERVIE